MLPARLCAPKHHHGEINREEILGEVPDAMGQVFGLCSIATSDLL
jgi:hypothetical protein